MKTTATKQKKKKAVPSIQRSELEKVIRETKGKIFRISFIKRSTNERRDMLARTEVEKDIKGVGLPYDRKTNGLVVLYDLEKEAYRAVPLDGIFEIKINGVVYTIKEGKK